MTKVDLGDTSDLPPELVRQLSAFKGDRIYDAIQNIGGEVSIDQILIYLYRTHDVVEKRRAIQAKIYQDSRILAVKGRKGVYRLIGA